MFDLSAQSLANFSLVLQAIIFSVLALAVYARLKHSHVRHAILMGVAIVLHTVAIAAIMIPSLISMRNVFNNLLTRFAFVTLTHATIGSLVELMGVWLVASWLFNTASVEKCFKRKNVMRVTVALWLAELILGVYVYMMLYLAA